MTDLSEARALETGPLLAGFSVRGYRSLGAQPVRVCPLSKVTCLIGQNNSGKSNVLRAAQLFLPTIPAVNHQGEWQSLAALDRSQDFPDLGADDVLFGVAVDGGADPDEFLVSRFVEAPKQNPGAIDVDSARAALRELSASLRSTRPGSVTESGPLLWLEYAVQGGSMQLSRTQARLLEEHLSQHGRQLGQISSALTSTAGGDTGTNVLNILRVLMPPSHIPVSVIPALRVIQQPEDSRVPGDEPDASGRNLPLYLKSLQAPSAEDWFTDQGKFERINGFLRSVLQRPDVSLHVPWDEGKGVYVAMDGKVLPLENLGSGISQLILIATMATIWDSRLVCIEEPEIHLHPLLLRSLVAYLRDETTNQYLIATHSSHLMDDPRVSVLRVAHEPGTGTTVEPAASPADRAAVAHHLGYRASDVLQANSIIWVEGPSDRTYVQHWLRQVDPDLVEGIHFSIMFYGGKNLAHVSGEDSLELDPVADDLILLPRLNRHIAIIIDSDRAESAAPINSTKRRIQDEFEQAGSFVWITQGREIENYVPSALFESAAKATHNRSDVGPITDDDYEDRFAAVGTKPNKVKIAEMVVSMGGEEWLGDLPSRVAALVAFIRTANGKEAVPARESG